MATNINVLDRAPGLLISGLNLVLRSFENPVGLERPLLRDFSKHQGLIDFGVSAENGVQLCASRSTISWGYQDTWWPRNWSEPAKVGMYRTGYHVIYPDQPIIRQADNWYKVYPTLDVIPRVIDAELRNGMTARAIGDAIWNLSNVVLSRDGVRPIIYSRYLLVNQWMAHWTTDMLNEHYWWLAQFLWSRVVEHAGPPTRPDRVREDRILIHQTADKKVGFAGEVQSKSVDWDRWELGNVMDMHQFIKNEWGEPEVEPCWYNAIDTWARSKGFDSVTEPPMC